MPRVLHIWSRTPPPLERQIREAEAESPGVEVITFDLRGAAPDYDALLQLIYEADSIQVW